MGDGANHVPTHKVAAGVLLAAKPIRTTVAMPAYGNPRFRCVPARPLKPQLVPAHVRVRHAMGTTESGAFEGWRRETH